MQDLRFEICTILQRNISGHYPSEELQKLHQSQGHFSKWVQIVEARHHEKATPVVVQGCQDKMKIKN